jgi:hypothetical protein
MQEGAAKAQATAINGSLTVTTRLAPCSLPAQHSARRAASLPTHGARAGRFGQVLGKVIKALGSKAAHVPWRDSTLTMLLRAAFGGRSRTAVVVTAGLPGPPRLQTSHQALLRTLGYRRWDAL